MKLYRGQALARELGISAGELEQLRKTGVIRYAEGTLYDPLRTAADIIDSLRTDRASQTADYDTERALLMRARRRRQELETEQLAGSLHEAREVEMLVGAVMMRFRARVMAIPAALAQRLAEETDTTKVYQLLKQATDDTLNELADYDRIFEQGDERQ